MRAHTAGTTTRRAALLDLPYLGGGRVHRRGRLPNEI